MGRIDRVVGNVLGAVGRRLARPLTPAWTMTAKGSNLLWRRRFHWPVVALGAAVIAGAVLGPTMSTPATVSAGDPGATLPASAWPGLVHHQATSPSLASSPGDLVPACAGGSTLTAGSIRHSHTGAPAKGGGTRIVLASLLAATPAVTSVTPDYGPITGGTAVVIDGSGFTGASAVLFGVVPSLSFTVVSDTEITASSPPGVGPSDVHVLTLGGLSATVPADVFTYVIPALPPLPVPLPGLPGAPGLPGSSSTGGSTPGTTTSPGSSTSGGSTAASPTPTTSIPPGTTMAPPALSPSTGALPGSDFPLSDGELGCGLIDSQTGVPVSGESAAQARAVQLALSFIGTPYVWGGESTHGFDCSGLVQFVYSAAGISLPRTAQEQYNAGPAVAPGQAVVPGDLVFFGSGPNDVGHVGIFVGNGVMVDAPHTGADVRLDQINGFEPVVGVTSPGQ